MARKEYKRGVATHITNVSDLTSQTAITVQPWTDWTDYGPNVPGWRQRIKEGSNATTPGSGFKVEYDFKNASYRAIYRKPPAAVKYYNHTGVTSPVGLTSPQMDYATANSKALSALVSKIVSTRRQFQAGVALGELSETIRMVRRPAKALFERITSKYIPALEKGRAVRGRTARRKYLSETWLEHSFGWAPLISDIDSGAKALATLVTGRRGFVKRVSGMGIDVKLGAQGPFLAPIGSSGAFWKFQDATAERAMVTFRAWLDVKTLSPGAFDNEVVGLTLRDFVPTAWELLPYSFLVDYFTNIGGMIEAACINRSTIRFMNRTIHRSAAIERRHLGWIHPSESGYVATILSEPCYSMSRTTSWSRGTYIGTLIPDLVFKIPGFGLKWLNMLALARVKQLAPFF
jgi:hypothetical protein